MSRQKSRWKTLTFSPSLKPFILPGKEKIHFTLLAFNKSLLTAVRLWGLKTVCLILFPDFARVWKVVILPRLPSLLVSSVPYFRNIANLNTAQGMLTSWNSLERNDAGRCVRASNWNLRTGQACETFFPAPSSPSMSWGSCLA